ncbi:monocarboxylate transporter 2-like [Amphiura filiformis]|uniref:monocarboxylate transporter 2-like n=1 Tax=Amphiura filiformis TaxID=82378 RepID=UPI003B22768C
MGFEVKNKWGWLVTFNTFLIIMPVTGVLSTWGVIFVELQKEFPDLSDLEAGWIGGLAFGIMFAASPISTGLFKRFGHRIIAIIGTILCSIGLLASSFVPSPHLLFLTYSILMGVGSNFIDNTTLNLVGSYFPRKNSARSTCFATLGWSIGSLALNPGVEKLSTIIGWRGAFQVLSAGLFLLGMIACTTFKPPPHRCLDVLVDDPAEKQKEKLMPRKQRASSTSSRKKSVIEPMIADKHTIKDYVKMFVQTIQAPGILLWLFANIWMNLSLIFPFVNMIKFMTTIGIPESQGAFVLTVVGIADLLGRGSSAAFGDSLPFNTIYVYPICNTIMAGATFFLLIVKDIKGMYIFSAFIGYFIGVVNSMLFKACIDLFGAKILAEAWTLTLLGAGFGIAVGPTVAGAAYDFTGSFDIAFYVGGGMFALAALFTLMIPFVQRRKQWVPPRTMSRRESQAVIKARESVSDNMNSASETTNEEKSKEDMLNEDEESGVFIDVKEKNEKNVKPNDVVDQYVWVV